jgi:hypothetical protein
MSETAYLYRERDGGIVEIAIPAASITRPAVLAVHPMQSRRTTSTGRARLPTTIQASVYISTSDLGPDEAERVRVQLVDSAERWRLYTPGRPGIRDLVIGTTVERRDVYQAVIVDLELTESRLFVVTDEAIGAPSPRADAAAGLASEEDRGTVSTQEPDQAQGSYVARFLGLGEGE